MREALCKARDRDPRGVAGEIVDLRIRSENTIACVLQCLCRFHNGRVIRKQLADLVRIVRAKHRLGNVSSIIDARRSNLVGDRSLDAVRILSHIPHIIHDLVRVILRVVGRLIQILKVACLVEIL